MIPDFFKGLTAKWDGSVGKMPALESVIVSPASANPLDDIVSLMQAAEQDLRTLAPVPQSSEVPAVIADDLMGRFGWLISTLREWSEANDTDARRLYGALAVAAIWDREGNLWNAIRDILPSPDNLIASFERILGSRQIQAQILPAAPLWEREHLENMLDADRNEDWARLAEIVDAFRLPNMDAVFAQAARALWTIEPRRLISVYAGCSSWLEVTSLLSALRLVDALHVAAEIISARARFSVLDLIANRRPGELSSEEQNALRTLFIAAAEDETDWPGIMRAFNRYPVRYPSMQQPLGQALAEMSPTAIRAYVDSIELNGNNSSRQTIAICLDEFRRHASAEQRCVLWERAYERWDAWGFGLDEDKNLMQPALSVIDYAVIGWLLECAPEGFIESHVSGFDVQLQEIDTEWYASVTKFKSRVNSSLSRYLLFERAKDMDGESQDWLASVQQNLTVELTNNYAKARFAF